MWSCRRHAGRSRRWRAAPLLFLRIVPCEIPESCAPPFECQWLSGGSQTGRPAPLQIEQASRRCRGNARLDSGLARKILEGANSIQGNNAPVLGRPSRKTSSNAYVKSGPSVEGGSKSERARIFPDS